MLRRIGNGEFVGDGDFAVPRSPQTAVIEGGQIDFDLV